MQSNTYLGKLHRFIILKHASKHRVVNYFLKNILALLLSLPPPPISTPCGQKFERGMLILELSHRANATHISLPRTPKSFFQSRLRNLFPIYLSILKIFSPLEATLVCDFSFVLYSCLMSIINYLRGAKIK